MTPSDSKTMMPDTDEVQPVDAVPAESMLTKRVLTQNTIQVYILIKSPQHKEEDLWKVSLGEKNSIYASIEDENFLKHIDFWQEHCSNGNLLLADLQITQYIVGRKIIVKFVILKIHQYKEIAAQELIL